jgi:hypothetical protein
MLITHPSINSEFINITTNHCLYSFEAAQRKTPGPSVLMARDTYFSPMYSKKTQQLYVPRPRKCPLTYRKSNKINKMLCTDAAFGHLRPR